MHYFIIPGNPPAAYFYELWGKEIEIDQPGSQARVSRYPLLPESSNSPQVMSNVLSSHLDQLKAFCNHTGSPCTVIGHSLGAYFAMGLLEHGPDLIHKAILLHPFLRSPSPLGKLILKTAGGISYSPKVQQSIIKARKGLAYLNSDIKHVSDDEIRISFQLARHEEATIGRDNNPITIQSHHMEKISVFHAQQDTWCSPRSVADLKKSVTVKECLEPHAFITSKHHRQNLFERIRG